MKRKSLTIGIVLIVLLLICAGIWAYSRSSNLHRPIKVENISSLTLWSGHADQKKATQEEIVSLVNWFNSASDIRENKTFAGETPDSGIVVKEKNGEEISIIRSGKDFEVQRYTKSGKIYSYWAIQKEIKTLLDDLAQ